MTQSLILQEICQELPFRVHSVKIEQLLCQKDLPMMFLAHYDSLDDDIKASRPLDLPLLQRMNDKVTASQACQLLNLPQNTIRPATHIKISGTVVLVFDELPLALRLSFTNTAKQNQALHGDDTNQLIQDQASHYLFAGNVQVLHKTSTHQLISINLDDDELIIAPNDGYTRLPNLHALATTHTLNTLKAHSPAAMAHLGQAIIEKTLLHFSMQD